jgi:transformation/transcription domain-associated protein
MAALQAIVPPTEAGAFEAGKEVMERLRGTHPVLCTTLESMVVEIGGRFALRPEERLLLVVTALLHRCYKVGRLGCGAS